MIHAIGLPHSLGAKKTLVLVAAMLAFVGLNAAAMADNNASETRVKKVSLVDIDLSTIEGQRAARERLHQTARLLCSRLVDEFDLSHHVNYLSCVDSAMRKAEPRLQAMVSRSGADLLARSAGN
jgi:UrcA family protein